MEILWSTRLPEDGLHLLTAVTIFGTSGGYSFVGRLLVREDQRISRDKTINDGSYLQQKNAALTWRSWNYRILVQR
jgi:hypothetical protein